MQSCTARFAPRTASQIWRPNVQLMNPRDRNLARKIALVMLLKLALLLALWWSFVREQRVTVDADKVAAQLLQGVPMPTQGVRP